MKILAVGDIHGRSINAVIEDMDRNDKVVFIGDYLDSFDETVAKQIYEFQRVIELKKENPDKVVLLIANHDWHYIDGYNGTSGFKQETFVQANPLFKENEDLFQLAYQVDNYLFTHAGIDARYWQEVEEQAPIFLKRFSMNFEDLGKTYADKLNTLYKLRYDHLFKVDGFRSNSRAPHNKPGGPIWADKRNTEKNLLKSIHQIVGHTPVQEIERVGDDEQSITYIDCHYNVGNAYFPGLHVVEI